MKWYEIQNKTSQILRDFQKDKEYQDCQITWIPYSSLLFSTISSSISAVMSRVVWEQRWLKNCLFKTNLNTFSSSNFHKLMFCSLSPSLSVTCSGRRSTLVRGQLWRDVNFGDPVVNFDDNDDVYLILSCIGFCLCSAHQLLGLLPASKYCEGCCQKYVEGCWQKNVIEGCCLNMREMQDGHKNCSLQFRREHVDSKLLNQHWRCFICKFRVRLL